MSKYLHQNMIVDQADAVVSPLDRGYYFGDGIYEVFRIYRGGLFEKDAHMKRLIRSAEQLRISLPYPIEEIGRLLEQLVQADPIPYGILYMQITRGCFPRVHAFPPADTAAVLTAYCKELPRPLAQLEQGVRIVSVPDIRWLRCDIKTLNLLGNVLARQEAEEKDADEAVMIRDGIVTECSSSNIMIVRDGTIVTHPANQLILRGITRQVVLELTRQFGVETVEERFGLETLYAADEVFMTGTTTEVMPVIQVDGQPIGSGRPGTVTRLLQQAFETQLQ